MATVDHPIPDQVVEARLRRLVVASVAAAGLAIATIGWATATRNHSFWAFVLWVGLTIAAVVTGVVALVRLPRVAARRNLRRLALVGVVAGVLCATLGLAVYSASRSDDCPPDQACSIPAPGSGQREQQP